VTSASSLAVLLGAAGAWALCCVHVVLAYARSPRASAFRAEWNNRYSAAGRAHLRWALVWGALAALLAVISFASG
jgi:hypothetical protein